MKRRNKHNGTRTRAKRRKKAAAPDDYFRAGPFEFARFGRVTMGRSVASAAQWREAHARMAEDFPNVVSEIDSLVERIAGQVAGLRPDKMLQRAWWELTSVASGLRDGDERDAGMALRMVDYVQSVIASVLPSLPYKPDITEEDWKRLTEDVETLFTRLSSQYQIAKTAHRRSTDPSVDIEREEFRFRAELIWMNVRGERYQVHEEQALLELLEPHSDVLIQLYGVGAKALVQELGKLLRTHVRGLHDAILELDQFREDVMERMSEVITQGKAQTMAAAQQEVFTDPEFSRRRDKIGGELFGLDLYDVGKLTTLPTALIDDLTWSPGEDSSFFASGEMRGWPLRIWPTMKRPFIRLDERSLSFDSFSIFDNFYRGLQRLILKKSPDYAVRWNAGQKAVSEELPFRYLRRILHEALTYRPVFYRLKADDGKTGWHECDGLLLVDDFLFVVEVKAGAFTYTSPATDLPSYLASLENLVKAPAKQGNRFVDYLESAPEVSIFDAEHNEVARLRREDFRQVVVCAATLDPFTELAARSQHLRKVGIEVGPRPVWVLSIDDLRVYADLFDNPLVYLHYVEQRLKGAQSQRVDVNDELDHFGLYLKENHYASYASALVADDEPERPTKLTFDGYRTPVDDYYSAVLRGENPVKPSQRMPARIGEIIRWLASSRQKGRAQLASFLLDCGAEYRHAISDAIERQIREHSELGRTRPMSTHGHHGCTVWAWSSIVPRDSSVAEKHARSAMIAAKETSRLVIELEYDETAQLKDMHWHRWDLERCSAEQIAEARVGASHLTQSRLAMATRQGKIGRNDPCPCGSGSKYKRCCGH